MAKSLPFSSIASYNDGLSASGRTAIFMFTRLKPRFSLLSLLLVLTIAALSISHWLASRELRRLRADWDAQRKSIRDLNDELGRLTVGEPTQVHVIATFEPRKKVSDVGARSALEGALVWDLHLPADASWRLCAAFGDIPPAGLPPAQIERSPLTIYPSGVCRIRFSVRHSPMLGWIARFEDGGQSTPYFIPPEDVAWLNTDCRTEQDRAGEGVIGPQTETFPPNQPVILLRVRRQIASAASPQFDTSDPNPCDGMIIWIEPVPADRKP